MGFRNPITSAEAVDTGAASGAGVRIYEDFSGGYPRGVIEFYNGVTASGWLTSSPILVDQGGGVVTTVGSRTQLKGINDHGHQAPYLDLNVEEDPTSGFRSVARIANADFIELPPITAGARNGGTSGKLSGGTSVPGPTSQLLAKTWTGNLLANAFGDNTISWPGGRFPEGLLFAVGEVHANDGTRIQCWGGTASACNIRFLTPAGATAANVTRLITVLGIGW